MASSRRMGSCDLIFVHRNELTCPIFKVFGTIKGDAKTGQLDRQKDICI